VYSFVAGAGLSCLRPRRSGSAAGALRSAAAEVVRQVPDLGAPLTVRSRYLPEIDGGWASIVPASASRTPLLSEICDATHAVLVLGQISEPGSAARLVRQAFLRGGVAAASDLRGVFSALIVERRRARIHLVTSVLGCRALRYRFDAGALCIAPTDLGVVALSGCELEFDLGALATLIACGWQLSGGSALKGVRECRQRERVSWARGQLRVRAVPPIQLGRRIEPADHAGQVQIIDRVIEELRDGVRHELGQYRDQIMTVPLTAGMDSRAVLALVLSLADPDQVITYTRGAGHQDARVAGYLARCLGIEHEARPVRLLSDADSLRNARRLAILNNGASNTHTAAADLADSVSTPPPALGSGGEVFRGFYYKYLWRQRAGAGGAEWLVRALLAGSFRRLLLTPFATPALEAAPARALERAVQSLTQISSDAHDLADLFFFFESVGRWSATLFRPCLGPCFAPFVNHRAVASAFELPAPLGDHAIVAEIIARFAPRAAFWTPVNGAGLLCLEGRGPWRRTSRELLRLGVKLARTAEQRWWPAGRTPKRERLAYLRGPLREALEDGLRSSNSFTRQLFTPAQLEHLLDPRSRDPNHFTIAGAVFSLDLWKAAQLAARSALPVETLRSELPPSNERLLA
jgi:hypothetical protein